MDIKKKLFKILSLDFSAKIILAVISLSLIRLMSTEDFALYTIIFTTVNLISSLIASVINKLFIVGDFEEEGYTLTNFLSFQILMVVFFSLILFFFKELFQDYLWTVCVLILLKVFMVFIQTYYQKSMEFRKYYQLEYLRIFSYLILFLIIFYLKKVNVLEMLLIQSLSLMLACLIYGYKLIRIKEILEINKTITLFTKTMKSEYKYLYLFSIGTLILVNVDIYMLRALDTTYQVAIFGAAFTFYSFLQLGLGAVHKLFLPLVNSIDNIKDIKKIYNQHLKISVYIFPLLILGIYLSDCIIPIIDGGKYPESIIIFKVLTLSAYLSFILSPYSNILFKYKEFRFQFNLIFAGIVIHIVLNYFIIQKYHAIGLAWVNLIVYLLVNMMMFIKSNKKINE